MNQILASIENVSIKMNIDIVFVIDTTLSMCFVLEKIKWYILKQIIALHEKAKEMLRRVEQIRIKIITFKDYYRDGYDAYTETPFIKIPDDLYTLYDYLGTIEAKGGGGEAKSALEAVTLALRSDFVETEPITRHVIEVFTDGKAYNFKDFDQLMKCVDNDNVSAFIYPSGMPGSINDLYQEWESDNMEKGLHARFRRITIFGPDVYPWNEIEDEWGGCLRFELSELEDELTLIRLEDFLFLA